MNEFCKITWKPIHLWAFCCSLQQLYGPKPKTAHGLQTKAQFGLYDPHLKQQEPEETTVAAAGEREERRGEVEEARARWRRRWGGSNPPSLTRRRGRCICFSAQSPSHLILFLHQSFPLSFGFVCGTNRLETFVFSSFTFLDADAVKVWFWRGISVLRYVLGVSANRGSDDVDEP